MPKALLVFLLFMIAANHLSADEKDFSEPVKTVYVCLNFIQDQNWHDLYGCFTHETTDRLEFLTKTYLGVIFFFAKKKIEDPDALKLEFNNLTGRPFFVRLLKYSYWQEPRRYQFEEIKIGDFVFDDNEVYTTIELYDKKDKRRKEKIYFVKEGSRWLIDLTRLIKKYDRR